MDTDLSDEKRAITSYGIILFTSNDRNRGEILYLLSQRRDSISYSEFLRDNLTDENISMHISLMSQEERNRCIKYYRQNRAQDLWDDLWVNHRNRIYKNDMSRCCESFNRNMEKYLPLFFQEGKMENSWGFAKGRKYDRNGKNETDLQCALREFEEETTIPKKDVQILNIKPYKEIYRGTDEKLYRTIYYVAYIPYIPQIIPKFSPNTIRQYYISEEVSELKWASYVETLSKLDSHKRTIITHLNKLLFTKNGRPPRRRYSN